MTGKYIGTESLRHKITECYHLPQLASEDALSFCSLAISNQIFLFEKKWHYHTFPLSPL